MSIYAGIYYYNSMRPVERELRTILKSKISRSPKNSVTEFNWPGIFIVQADIGAFGHSSFVRLHDGGALIVAGQLLVDSTFGNDKLVEMEQLATSVTSGNAQALRGARGNFSLVGYFPQEHRLLLAVDRLGVRPLYYYDDGKQVVFATTLRVFESLGGYIRFSVDLQAVKELSSFGFPLGDRTPFKEVRCMRGGVAKSWMNEDSGENIYWRWDQVLDRPDGGEEAAQWLHKTFMDAVQIRNGNDRNVQAFLSGGMDSRCIVNALLALGLETHSYNISWLGSCDEIIGANYARHIGTCHHAFILPEDKAGWAWPRLIAEVLEEKDPVSCAGVIDRPRIVWSGDGGSVGLGRVYMDEAMVRDLRVGDNENAVRRFLTHNNIGLCGGTLNPKVRKRYEESFIQAVIDEIIRFECADPGKALFLFLLENDQRRHMASFYEEIDVNRVEYQMPFFDGEFLAAATALPLDVTLFHRFYSRYWIYTFGNSTLEVPWQAYPGHDPCPLPLPDNASYQWSHHRKEYIIERRKIQALQAFRCAFSDTLPADIFSRWRLAAIGVLAAIIGRDYSYLLTLPNKIIRYESICRDSISGEKCRWS